MNQIDNTFTKGMNLDLHPSAIPSDTLISCLNGTMKTNNGNEGILQNDLGNVKLKYAHLPEGFIPLGMKEYGGIIYVASKNPDTDECQIGSVPSPQRILEAEDTDSIQPAEIKIADFIKNNEGTKELKTTRILHRLSSNLEIGSKFGINSKASQTATEQTSRSFPMYLDSNLGVLNENSTNKFLRLNVALKDTTNSIKEINETSSNNNNYLRDSGELYLIAEVLIPEQFEIYITNATNNSVTIQWDKSLNNPVFYINTVLKDLEDHTIKTVGDYNEVTFTTGTTREVTIKCIPTIRMGTDSVLVNELTKEITIDLDDYSSSVMDDESFKSNAYKTTYTEYNNTLRINWGLSNAKDVSKVDFNFYLLGGDYRLSLDYQQTISGKPTFNGFFSNSFKDLVSNRLYLLEVVCYNVNQTKRYYKWVWSSETVQGNSLSLFLEVTGSLEDEEVETEGNTTPTIDSETGALTFSKTYYKTVSFTPDQSIQFANPDKLPFNITPPDCTTSLNITKGNHKHKKENSLIGSMLIDASDYGNASITGNTLNLHTTYYAQAYGYEYKSQITGKQLKPYYTENTSDADFIFGKDQNTCPRYGLAIAAGILYQDVGAEWVRCTIDFNTWDASGGVESTDNIVHEYDTKYKNRDTDNRSWFNRVHPGLIAYYAKRVGFYPPISFILGPPDTGRYHTDKRLNPYLYKMTGTGDTSHHANYDYSLILWKDTSDNYRVLRSIHSKRGGYDDLKNLFKNLYIVDNKVETNELRPIYVPDKNNYGYTSTNELTQEVTIKLNFSFGENINSLKNNIQTSITTALTNLTSQEGFTDSADFTAFKSSNDSKIEIQIEPNPINDSFSKTYTLETKNIVPLFSNSLTASNALSDINSTYAIYQDDIIREDDEGNEFLDNVIYYKTADGFVAPLGSNKTACVALSGFNLAGLRNKFTIADIGNSEKGTKRCILLKDGQHMIYSPNRKYTGMHAAPFIGELGSEHHNESYTYPFTFATNGNYKCLCDYKLKESCTSLW